MSSGATLVVAPAAVPGDVAALARLLADAAIGVVQLVPSLLAALLEQAELSEARALRLVFCGGEALAAGTGAAVPGAAALGGVAQSLRPDRGDHRRHRVVVRRSRPDKSDLECVDWGAVIGGSGVCVGRSS